MRTASNAQGRRPRRCLGACAAALLLAAGPAGAEVREHLHHETYVANASRFATLREALNAASPIRQSGEVFHGYTRWNIAWNYRWHEEPGGRCRITQVSTELQGHITLPSITDAGQAAQREFDRYLARLREHEMGHWAIAQSAARDIDRRIMALPAASTCGALEQRVNETTRYVIDRHRERERDYDAQTGHGRTQGAWLER